MKQLAFPGLEELAARTSEAKESRTPIDAAEAALGAPEGQLQLFDDYTALRRELEWALDQGLFEEALRLRGRLAEAYGPSAAAPFAFLEALGADLWHRRPAEVLAALSRIADALSQQPALRARVQRAVLARLIAARGADALVADVPAALPAVFDALYAAAEVEASGVADARSLAQARRLVRDALLSERSLEPLDFRDPAVRDVLAEDASPMWMACLGVVRRLWPVTPAVVPSPAGDASEPGSPDGEDDDARARAFWRCLQVTEDRGTSEASLHEARRRMKRLNPQLHALYLRRLV